MRYGRRWKEVREISYESRSFVSESVGGGEEEADALTIGVNLTREREELLIASPIAKVHIASNVLGRHERLHSYHEKDDEMRNEWGWGEGKRRRGRSTREGEGEGGVDAFDEAMRNR